MNKQILDIWKYFFQFNVRYITIGGFAVNIYGYNRATGDINIYLDDIKENRIDLRNAFIEIGFRNFK